MQTTNKPPRLNFNVPRSLVNEIRDLAAERGIEPSWWLRKVIEKALAEAGREGRVDLPPHNLNVQIDLGKLEAFRE